MAKVVKDNNSIQDLLSSEEFIEAIKDAGKQENEIIKDIKQRQVDKLKELRLSEDKFLKNIRNLKEGMKSLDVSSEAYADAKKQLDELNKQYKGKAEERKRYAQELRASGNANLIDRSEEQAESEVRAAEIALINKRIAKAEQDKEEALKEIEWIEIEEENKGKTLESQKAKAEAYKKVQTAEQKIASVEEAKKDPSLLTKNLEKSGREAFNELSFRTSIADSIKDALTSDEHTSITGKMSNSIGEALDNTKFGKALPVSMSKIVGIAGKILDIASATRKTINSWVDDAASVLAANVGRINAALEGTGKTYKDSIEGAVEGLGLNRFVKQTEYLSQIANLTTRGIAFNVEQRALLETIKDKTISSFSSMEGSLLRLIRLKQQDVTAQQFGLEVALRNTLNKVFKDSTYLQDMYDAISGAITDAVLISGKGDIIEYGSVAQTWMGAMYESGIDSSTVNKFANAINYLGSGNVQGLASDSEMQRLVLLSMDTIGMDYADILQQGLSSSDITDLMKAIVNYLVQISNNTKNNNVLTSSYTQLFGMSMADLQGFRNLQGSMNSLAYVNSSNVASVLEHELALYQSDERVLVNEQIENIFDNAKFAFGSDIAGNATQYLSWKMSNLVVDIVEQVVGNSFMGSNIMGKAASKAIGAVGIGAELVLFANIFKGLLSTLEEFPAVFQSGNNGRLQDLITVNGGPSLGGNSVSTSVSATTNNSDFKAVTTYSDIKSGEKYQKSYESYSADEAGWDTAKPEEDKVLTELKKITSALVEAQADEAHKALATFLVGMTDDTLRSFASIFADEDAMQDTFQGKNNVLKDNLFKFAEDTTSNSSKTTTSNKSSSNSTTSSGNIKTT